MKVIWMLSAEEQLEDIYNFLARQNIKFAVNTYNTIIEEADKLVAFPEIAAKELLLAGEVKTYRSLIVNKTYKVVYRFNPEKEEVVVVSVWDCRQDPKTLKTKTMGK